MHISTCLSSLAIFGNNERANGWEDRLWKGWIILNSLWPSDAIQQHRCGSTLPQVMACCLTAPSHYLNQYWFLISEALWDSPDSNFTVSVQPTILYNRFENYVFDIIATSRRDQRVNYFAVHLEHLLQVSCPCVHQWWWWWWWWQSQ